MTNKKMIGGIVIIILLVVLIVAVVAGSGIFAGSQITTTPKEQKYTYECSVIVKEKLIGNDLYLDSVNCENTGSKCGGLFNFFQTKGDIEMWDSLGRLSSKSFETGTFSGEVRLTIKGCTADSDIRIRLYDSEHNFIEEK